MLLTLDRKEKYGEPVEVVLRVHQPGNVLESSLGEKPVSESAIEDAAARCAGPVGVERDVR